MSAAETTDDVFFCDIGFKAILRAIRSLVLQAARLPKRPNIDSMGYQKFKQACLKFFSDYVVFNEVDMEDVLVQGEVMKLLHIYLDVNQRKSSGQSRVSTFSSFNQKFLETVA